MAGQTLQKQPFSGACGAFGAGGTEEHPAWTYPAALGQDASPSWRFTGGCSAPPFPCSGTPLGPSAGEERKTHAALSPRPGSVLVSPAEIQTRTRELRQLPRVPSPPQQGWSRRQQCGRGPTAIAVAAADKSLLAIKTVTCCKQQKLTTITKNYQQTESLSPS